jgi:hypothetical protein
MVRHNTLHIITALYRFENLEKIHNSIYMNDDIVWHISKSNEREDLTNNFIKTDKRVKVYNVECEDSDTTSKRNVVLETIKDGYFCFLDDDTIFHENMYIKYRECVENSFVGILVGEQLDWDGKLRLIAHFPKYCRIDTGNVLAHHSCLETCRWPDTHIPKVNEKDSIFWESVYDYYGKKCAIWNQPISYYNQISKKIIKYKK